MIFTFAERRDRWRKKKPVEEVLAEHSAGICDRCLVETLEQGKDAAITPARKLEREGRVKREQGLCNVCSKRRVLNLIIPKTVT